MVFYISRGDPQKAKELIPDCWVWGRDYLIESREQIPESSLNTKEIKSTWNFINRDTEGYISVLTYKRNCKCEYLPWPGQLTIGNEEHDDLSYWKEMDPEELPLKLYNICRYCMLRIDALINETPLKL